MIDIAILRKNPDLVRETVRSRNAAADIDALLALDERVRTAQQILDESRHGLKQRSQSKPTSEERAALQKLSADIREQERELTTFETQRDGVLTTLPNFNSPETPVGTSEADNQVVRTVGDAPSFDFEPKPYWELPSVTPHLHLEQGSRVSGSRFYYLSGPLALLQRAVFDVVHAIVARHGFIRIVPPVLVREPAMYGTGHFPAERNEIYSVNPGEDDLFLVGTAEVPLMSLHADEIITDGELPKMYVAETTCFRREAGSYGKDQQGILRVHQFQKIEMVALVTPEESVQMHKKFLAIEEEIVQTFGLHYHVLNICTADLGYPAAQKFDIEAYFPSQQRYRELTSTSNTTDYQTRRLHIRCRRADGSATLAHSINGTGATDRLWLAILEQYQQADGTVRLPTVLHDRLPWKTLPASAS